MKRRFEGSIIKAKSGGWYARSDTPISTAHIVRKRLFRCPGKQDAAAPVAFSPKIFRLHLLSSKVPVRVFHQDLDPALGVGEAAAAFA